MADFIVETTYADATDLAGIWQIAVDGSAAQAGAGADIVMTSPEGEIF